MTPTEPYGLISLWQQGDLLTRGLAIALLVMSIVSWYVILTRAWQAWRLRRAARAAAGFWHTQSFAEGLQLLEHAMPESPFHSLALEGQSAVNHHRSHTADLHGQLSLGKWLTESLRGAIDDAQERMNSGLAVLASVGATAPFVGLFGTVWGIYHALVRIGVSGQASIDRIAGPVGEALVMTAFGLAVAIPAVLGYNALVRANRAVVNRLNRFARQLHGYFMTGSPMSRESNPVRPLRPVQQVRPGGA